MAWSIPVTADPSGTGPVGSDSVDDAPTIFAGQHSQPTPNADLTADYMAEEWQFGQTAWWKFLPATTGWVEITALILFPVDHPNWPYYGEGLAVLDANMEPVMVGSGWVAVTKLEPLYVVVGESYGNNIGEYVLQISPTQAHQGGYNPDRVAEYAGGDNFTSPGVIVSNESPWASTAAGGFTVDPEEPWVNVFNKRSAWWTWTAEATGWAWTGPLNQATISVWTGDAIDALALVGWAGPNNNPSWGVMWEAEAGVTYRILVQHYSSSDVANISYAPSVTLRQLQAHYSPCTDVALHAGWTGTVVGGANALSTPSMDSYVAGVGHSTVNPPGSSSFFDVWFDPFAGALPHRTEWRALNLVAIVEAEGDYDLYAPGATRTHKLSFWGQPSGLGRVLDMPGVTATPRLHRCYTGMRDYNYEMFAHGTDTYGQRLELSMEYITAVNPPPAVNFKVYYVAFELLTWREVVEVATPMMSGTFGPTRRAFVG